MGEREGLGTRLIILFKCDHHSLLYIQVNRRFRQGDVEGAQSASEKAQLHSQRAIFFGIIMWGAILLFFGCGLLFVFLYCYDHYRYYGYI